ncbi:MAG: hypothetical protein IJ832_07255 [Bacteroidaceae bacterium]|nr:hypothetical protein [Bacteroidaceae bacterium]
MTKEENNFKMYSHIIDNPPKGRERSYELARQMLPVLISWAQEHRSPQYYSTLAKTIGHKTPRIGFQLGIVADIINQLNKESGEKVPYLNALVISKSSKRPSDGLGDVIDEYYSLSEEKKFDFAYKINQEAYEYKKWPWVLKSLGLLPFNGNTEEAVRKGSYRNSASEGPYHKALKEYVIKHPEHFDVCDVKERKDEHTMLSGDRLDVYFKLKDGKQVAVEVKSRISDDADILRGIYQCVKYKAVLAAECLAHGENANVDAFLVVEKEMSEENRKTANMLSIRYIIYDKLIP